jgi:hypothetical protein
MWAECVFSRPCHLNTLTSIHAYGLKLFDQARQISLNGSGDIAAGYGAKPFAFALLDPAYRAAINAKGACYRQLRFAGGKPLQGFLTLIGC